MFLTLVRSCRFLALPRPSLKLFQFCIELEANLASTGNHDALVTARKLFDSAINHYPQERELWRKYYNMELKVWFTYCYLLLLKQHCRSSVFSSRRKTADQLIRKTAEKIYC
jgi:hypothetical protein